MQTRERLTVEPDETRLIAYRSPASRCKDLLLGPPLAIARLVGERLRKAVAPAVFSSDAIQVAPGGGQRRHRPPPAPVALRPAAPASAHPAGP